MRGSVPTFVPAPLVNDSDYGQFARRPLSARPGSAKSQSSFKQQSIEDFKVQHRRPQSATVRSESVDYSGVSNMIRGISFKKSKFWREKSPEHSKSNDGANVYKPKRAWKDVEGKDNVSLRSSASASSKSNMDIHAIRRHRSSHYAKFKYPQNYHYGQPLSHMSYLERNIPQCLRRFPQYCNQPKRQSCNFKPPNGVTRIKSHTIKSAPLPAYKGPTVPKTPLAGSERAESVRSDESIGGSGYENNQPHNGTYHYIYGEDGGNVNDLTYDLDEYDEINNNTQKETETVSEAESGDHYDSDFEAGPESVEVPIKEDIDDVIEEDLEIKGEEVKHEQTSSKKSSVSDAESIKSWVDPDEHESYYEEQINIEHDKQNQDDAQSNVEHSDHSRKSSTSQRSKGSSNLTKSQSVEYSDSDIKDILESDNDSIKALSTANRDMNTEGRFSRMDGSSVSRESRFRKTVRIHEPATPRSPATPRIDVESDDDIQEDFGSDDQFDMNDISALPSLSVMGPSGNAQGSKRYNRPSSARRHLRDDF